MTTRFDICLPRILVSEGGWVNDHEDPGGETNLGITRRVYEAWTHQRGVDMRHLTPAMVSPIYHANYWNAVLADSLPAGVDYMVVDAGINNGIHRAVPWLQTIVGVAADGHLGPVTIAAVHTFRPRALIDSYHGVREAFFRSRAEFHHFGDGWLARLERVTADARRDAA